MNVFELVGKLTLDGADKVNQQLSGLEKNAEKVQKGMRIAGAAFTAVGAAGLAIVQSTKKINAQLGVTALNLGVTTKEMRDLTLATTNVTFPIDEVTASFDLLARAGVKDTQVLKDTAIAFDTLGDATGKSASEVTAKMVPAMKTFGLTAGEVAGKSDAMTYLIRNSTVSMDNFGSVVGYITPELVNMGLTMDDTIALMGIMESKGMSGEVATRAFRTAITQATREQIPLNEALGITSEEMAEYQKKLDGATGMTQEYADVANEQYTLMDKVKQKWSELTLAASGFLEPLEPVLAGMTALGPVLMGLSMVKIPTLKAALHGLKAAFHTTGAAATSMWGAITLGVSLAITAGILLWQNWDKVSAFLVKAWANIKIAVLTGVEKILEGLSKFTSWIPILGDKVQEAHDAISNMIAEEKVARAARRARDAFEEVGEALEDIIPALEDVAEAAEWTADDMIRYAREVAGEAKDNARETTRAEIDAINDRMKAHRDAHQERMDALRDEYNQTIKTIDAELDYALKGYESQIDAIDRQIEAIDDAQRGRQDAERKAELEASIAAETDADRRADLEERLNELLIESDNKQWQDERKLAYEARIAEEEDADGRMRLEQRLADFLLEIQSRRTRRQLENDRDALRQEMDMAREEARNAKDQAQEAYDYRRELQEQEFGNLMIQLESEKEALDTALEEKLRRYDEDLEAFEALLAQEEEDTAAFVAAYNELMAQLKDKTVTITTVHRDVYVSGGGGWVGGGEVGRGERTPIVVPGQQYGGVIPEPTLLFGLRSLRPYAIAGERGREFVTPDRGGGFRTLHLTVELDRRAILDWVGENLVKDIRLRAGLHI